MLKKGAANKPGSEAIVGDFASKAANLNTEAANKIGKEVLANFTLNGETGCTYNEILIDILKRNLTHNNYEYAWTMSFVGRINYLKNQMNAGKIVLSEKDQGILKMMDLRVQKDGNYAAGDLNAFAGQRWNALYYTKSYEASKPLLADFKLSYNNNEADKNYQPVHRFGEGNCYNLNKYNFESKSDGIYLSVKQSDNQKAAVADVPAVVGTMLSKGYIFLAGGAGIIVGAGAMFLINHIQKKKKFA